MRSIQGVPPSSSYNQINMLTVLGYLSLPSDVCQTQELINGLGGLAETIDKVHFLITIIIYLVLTSKCLVSRLIRLYSCRAF